MTSHVALIMLSLVLLACEAMPRSAAPAATLDTWTVDAGARPGGDGSERAPFRTVAAALARAGAGHTVVVRPGSYREELHLTRPVTVVGAKGAVLLGSDVWTGWQPAGAAWTHAYPISWYRHGQGQPRARLADQVFVDGSPLEQVTSHGGLRAGTFWVDQGLLYLGTDPTGHQVEVTTRERWVVGEPGAHDVTLRGLTMRHAAAIAQRGGVWDGGQDRWTLEDCDLSYAHGAGLQLNGNGAVVRRSRLHHHGQIGLVTSYSEEQRPRDLRVEACEIDHNNTEGFDAGWEAGGTKFSRLTGLVVTGCDVHDNAGTGLWCDIDVVQGQLRDNRVHHNQDRGICVELSRGMAIAANRVWANGFGFSTGIWGAGILVQNSSDCEVQDNLVAWNADGIGVVQQDRGRWTPMTGNQVHDNVVAGQGTLLGWVSEAEPATLFALSANNQGARNRYLTGDRLGADTWLYQGRSWGLSELAATGGDRGATRLTSSALAALLRAAGLPPAPAGR